SSTSATTGTAVIWDGTSLFQWSGSQWNTVTTSGTTPSAVCGLGLAGRPDGSVILFGGHDASNVLLNQTFLLNSSNQWVHLAPSTSPSPRIVGPMSCNSTTGTVVLFGGYDTQLRGDTWEFGGTTWTQTANSGPPARLSGGMGFRPSTQTMTMIGGS